MSDFDDDNFDDFEGDNNFDDFNSEGSLKEIWQNNPLIKIFTIIAGIVVVVAAIVIFTGDDDGTDSRLGHAPDQSEVLGGEISQNYADVLEEVNEQRLENAVRQGGSTIPLLINPEEQELLTQTEETPPYEEFDPLATFRAANELPKAEEVVVEEPVLISPQDLAPVPQSIPVPSPEAVQALAQAMAADISKILGNHIPTSAKIQQVTPSNYFEQLALAKAQTGNTGQMVDTDGDGIPDTLLSSEDGPLSPISEEIVETIVIPAGEIEYAQILIEANSDVPGPVLAQLVSGPLAGAKLLGSFSVAEEYLVLSFNTIVVDGINKPITAIAMDPGTTLSGVATEVDHRYWSRVLLPAAAKFLEGIGKAISEDTETTVTVSGDTVIQEQKALDFEQELGKGFEEGLGEVAEFMEDEADKVKVLVRVARGTAVGILFTEPVLE